MTDLKRHIDTLTPEDASPKKKVATDDNPNADIIDILKELAEYEKNVTRQRFKFAAYQKAVKVLEKLDHRLKSGDEAKKLDGIGEKIGKKIDEILATGTLKKVETIRCDDTNKVIADLCRVTGIGPKHALQFMTDFKIENIEDLRKNKNDVKKAMTAHQLIGLKYVEDFEERIPREEVEHIRDAIFEVIHKVDPDFQPTVCGSFRRGAATCGDVDILLTHPKIDSNADLKTVSKEISLAAVVKQLEEAKIVTDQLALGDQKFMGVCILPKDDDSDVKMKHRRLDIRLIPHDHFYCALLYFTGSDSFNKSMRQKALSQGYTINEYSIRKVGSTGLPGEPLPVSSEQDVFDYIDMEYRDPEDRNE